MVNNLTISEIITWITNKLVETVKVLPMEIDIDKDFSEYGLDSLKAVSMVGEIEQWIEKELPATTLWDYTTIRQLASFIHQEVSIQSLEDKAG